MGKKHFPQCWHKLYNLDNLSFFFFLVYTTYFLQAKVVPLSRFTRLVYFTVMLSLCFFTLLPVNKFTFCRFDLSSPFICLDIRKGIRSSTARFIAESDEFSFFGSLPPASANKVLAFNLTVSSKYKKETFVHFLDLDFAIQEPTFWSTISVPPLVNSYNLYTTGFLLLSNLVDRSGSTVETSNTFFFYFEVSATWLDKLTLPSFLHQFS